MRIFVLVCVLSTLATGCQKHDEITGAWHIDVLETSELLFRQSQSTLPHNLQSRPGDSSYPGIRRETELAVSKKLYTIYEFSGDGSFFSKHLDSGTITEGQWTFDGQVLTTQFDGDSPNRWQFDNTKLRSESIIVLSRKRK